ncbi:Tm-1-like ATP-binding domain-containing protein [Ulvibacterium sp.]|uniref:Tm-1-like ATP-binding domain-containing protein n=1 Tax=Ulvibacterium sp. TaxID=2665914 RepID=UPI003BA87D4D
MKTKSKSIVMLGCFDTKGEDFSYLLKAIRSKGQPVITIDTGIMVSTANFSADYDNTQVAHASGTSIETIRKSGDRGKAVELMGKGAAAILKDLVSDNRVKGVIGMGGGGGTYIALEAMQPVPLGIPKLCLSTLAGKDLSCQIGIKDITIMASVVDVAGLNSISKVLMNQAAAAICGMAEEESDTINHPQKRIAISMFGNTTKCVNKCSELLKEQGYEVLSFHATGTGGAAMESLIKEGAFQGVLDVTVTELADELCAGILSAGPCRLTAAASMGIPQVVVPGCLDMVNYAQVPTVPEKYSNRQLYSWSPDITLMRTNMHENRLLGKEVARKLKNAKGPVSILLPLKGISQLDSKGELFYAPETDAVLFGTIKENAKGHVPVIEVDAHINDESFSIALVSYLLEMIDQNTDN